MKEINPYLSLRELTLQLAKLGVHKSEGYYTVKAEDGKEIFVRVTFNVEN